MERRLWNMWWAGALALATFVHVGRLLAGFEVAVNGVVVPMWVSALVVLLAGPASLWLVRRGRGVG